MSLRFRMQVLDAVSDTEFEAPPDCDGYPLWVEAAEQLGGMALIVVWRVTPPPIPTQPPSKRKK